MSSVLNLPPPIETQIQPISIFHAAFDASSDTSCCACSCVAADAICCCLDVTAAGSKHSTNCQSCTLLGPSMKCAYSSRIDDSAQPWHRRIHATTHVVRVCARKESESRASVYRKTRKLLNVPCQSSRKASTVATPHLKRNTQTSGETHMR